MSDTITDDPTIEIRRQVALVLNERPCSRAQLEGVFGRVWDASEMAAEFNVVGFQAPLVVVRRDTDQRLGSLIFTHDPRFYFAFAPHEGER